MPSNAREKEKQQLREELQRFATDDLQIALNGLYNRIEHTLKNELHGILSTNAKKLHRQGSQGSWQVGAGYTKLSAFPREDSAESSLYHENTGGSVQSPLLREQSLLQEQWKPPREDGQDHNSSDDDGGIDLSWSGGVPRGAGFDSTVRFQSQVAHQNKHKVQQRSSASGSDEDLDDHAQADGLSSANHVTWANRYRASLCNIQVPPREASTMSKSGQRRTVATRNASIPFNGGFRKSYASLEVMDFDMDEQPDPMKRQQTDDLSANVHERVLSKEDTINSGSSRGTTKTKGPLANRKTFGSTTDEESVRYSYTQLSPVAATGLPSRSLSDRFHQLVASLVMDSMFDYTIGGLILLNAALLGFETDWQARNWPKDKPPYFEIANTALCGCFTVEIVMRLYVHGSSYFSMAGWAWNVFDLTMVALQLLEEFARLWFFYELRSRLVWHYQFVVLRVMRIFRIVRVLRLVHVLHVVGELRMLLVSVAGSVRSLFWTVLVLLLLTYVFGLYLTQLVVDYRMNHPEEHEGQEELLKYYGDLARTMLSLYQTISDGIHWHEVMDPLALHCSQWIAPLFAFYIAFALFAFMNVITGVFVESAMRTAEEDKRRLLINQMKYLFEGADVDNSGTISWPEFQSLLERPELQTYLKAIDLHQEEARELFHLLDCDGQGEIDAVDFVNGCLRLHGSAKAIDFAAFLHEYRWLSLKLMDHVTYAEMCWAEICPNIDPEREEAQVQDLDEDGYEDSGLNSMTLAGVDRQSSDELPNVTRKMKRAFTVASSMKD